MEAGNTKKHSWVEKGCGILFLLPFLVIGVVAFTVGAYRYVQDPTITEDKLALLGLGSMFTLVGGGFFVMMLVGSRIAKGEEALEAEYPDEPWMWKKDWANGRVPSATPVGIFVGWIFALAFCGFSIPLVVKIAEELSEGIDEPGVFIGLLFPLAGLGMLTWAIYATLRWFKFGQSYCDLIANPGVVGGRFTAVIWAGYRHRDDDTAMATLTCFHKYESGTGKNRSTKRKILWQEEHTIRSEGIGQDDQGRTALPVDIYIPLDCKPTTLENPKDCIEWQLEVHSDLPGIDFRGQYIVPVFVTADSSDTVSDVAASGDSAVSGRADYKPTILIQEHVDGVEFTAPPRRNMGTAFGLSIFLAIWTGAIVFMSMAGAGIFFVLVFGLFELLIGWFTLWLWFGTINMSIRNGQIELTKTVLGIGGTKTQDGASVEEVKVTVGMTSNDRAYYRIILVAPENKRTVTLTGIRSKQEAEDLAVRIRGALGMD